MAAQRINGREIADQILVKTKELLKTSSSQVGLTSIVIGNNKLSHFFADLKGKTANSIGMRFEKKSFPEHFSPALILEQIHQRNADNSMHGIVIQLPLPSEYRRHMFLKAVHPYKDVDCLHPKNIGLMVEGHPVFLPPVVLAVLETIKATGKYPTKRVDYFSHPIDVPDLTGVPIAVIGAGILVGHPLMAYLPHLGATVTLLHEHSTDIERYTKLADIVITGTNGSDVLQPDQVAEGSIIIPVGNDIDEEKFESKHLFISPNRGGIGPLTIAHLLRNTVLATLKSEDA